MLNTSPKANYTLILGRKFYEFTNHLGNVLIVFTDLKIPQDTDNNNLVDNYKIGITRTADYSPFGVELDGRTLTYSIPVVTNGTPTVIYQHKFDDSPSTHPYTGTPTNLDPNLTQVNWTNSLNSWTNFTGHTGRAIAISNTVQDTARLYLNLSVTNGFLLDVTSYSFRHRSSPTGYANYNLYINNVFVGSGAIFVSSSNSLQTTGILNVSNAIAGLSGTVTVRLDLFNRVGPLTQGTFRMDDFVLNGYTTATENWSPLGYRYWFNGMESDPEFKGQGNSYTTEFRQYDARVGRWLSLDPLAHKYSDMSPYNSFCNNPIYFIDKNGDDIGIYTVNSSGHFEKIKDIKSEENYDMIYKQEDWDNKDYSNGEGIWDKNILSGLSQIKKDQEIQIGTSLRGAVNGEVLAYVSEGKENEVMKLFYWLANNVSREYAVTQGIVEGKLITRIGYYYGEYGKSTTLDAETMGFEIKDVKMHIHNHPSYYKSQKKEEISMGNDNGRYVESDMNSDWENKVNEYYKFNKNPYSSYVYFHCSQNLYSVNPTGTTQIKKVNSHKEFPYFGSKTTIEK
jgi:RHS repeat-associated protein